MRANFRSFTDHCDIDITDPVACLCSKSDGMLQELSGTRPAPLRVARREVLSDVSCCHSTKDRIDQSMDRDVGIAMPGKAMRMVNFDAAEPQVFTISKPVDVIAGSEPDRRQGFHKILCKSDFAHGFVARDHGYADARRARDLGIVACIGCSAPRAMSRQNGFKMECLRGLDPAQLLAPGASGHHSVQIDGQAVDDRQNGDRTGGRPQCIEQADDHVRHDNRAGCVMDQHISRGALIKRFQCGLHRLLPGFTANHCDDIGNACQRVFGDLRRPVRNSDHHRTGSCSVQGLHRVANKWFSLPLGKLFGQGLSRPQPLASSHDNRSKGAGMFVR